MNPTLQNEILEAVEKYGSQRAAARALSIPESTLRRRLKQARSDSETSQTCETSNVTAAAQEAL